MHCKASTRKWQAFLAVVIGSVHRTVFLAVPENDTHDAEPARHYISRVASWAAAAARADLPATPSLA